MAQVLPQSHAPLLLSTPDEFKDGTPLNMLGKQPDPDAFRFPAQSDDPPQEPASPGPVSSPASRSSAERPSSQRHTRRHMSLALPSFSFNPGASADAAEVGPRTPSSPRSPLAAPQQSSPSRGGRHRRIHSEFIGGDMGRSPITTRESTPVNDEVNFRDLANDLPSSKAPSKGHRHRRSGAVSSQDLSAIGRQAVQSAASELKSPASNASLGSACFPAPTFASSTRPGADYLRSGNESPTTSKSSSPVRVSFAENIEVIPRRSLPTLRSQPISSSARAIHSSDGVKMAQSFASIPRGGDARQSPLNMLHPWSCAVDEASEEPVDDPRTDTDELHYSLPLEVVDEAPIEIDGEVQSVTPGSFAFPSDSYDDSDEQFGEPGFVTLSEDFDMDPTSADVSLQSQPAPPLPAHYSDMRSSAQDGSDSVVDLDSALEISDESPPSLTSKELRILRAKSFSAARRSMHSSGLPAATPSPLHRRTESAPSLPMPSFDRPTIQRFNSETASEKGFQMENVFEEDEEIAEEDTAIEASQLANARSTASDVDSTDEMVEDVDEDCTPRNARTASNVSGKLDTATDHGSPTKGNSNAIKSNKWLTEAALRDSVSTITPDLLGSISNHQSDGMHDTPHSLRSSPPATPGTPSGVWNSSTCDDWPPEGASAPYSEASSFMEVQQLGPPKALPGSGRLSSDGTPSLISSRSTMASGAQRQGSSVASPHTVDSATLGEPPSSSGSGAAYARWRKRSSIASLSRLMTTAGSTRSHLSAEYSPRCQTSDGLSSDLTQMPEPRGKRQRLSRLLKIFRPKEQREQAPG